jgi:predicted negative regulator of RcsB-dependent stress response
MTHITIERAKLEQVLEALKTCDEDEWHSEDDFGLAKTYDENKVDQAIASCEQALAQPAQEPVGYFVQPLNEKNK